MCAVCECVCHVGRRVNTDGQLENGESVVLRRKPAGEGAPTRSQRSKEDIHLANLKKKTRKRTRKFEIDGVVITTTTSKVGPLGDYDFKGFWRGPLGRPPPSIGSYTE